MKLVVRKTEGKIRCNFCAQVAKPTVTLSSDIRTMSVEICIDCLEESIEELRSEGKEAL